MLQSLKLVACCPGPCAPANTHQHPTLLLTYNQVTIKGCTGPVNTFVIEPFVPHKEEMYLCIQSNRLDIEVGREGVLVFGVKHNAVCMCVCK